MSRVDVVVVGAGIIGLSVARALLEHRGDLRIVVVDKEERVASHQSGRNSGVIHSGVYYRPGTLKARLATTGRIALVEFCRRAGIPYKMRGKVIVATKDRELETLDELRRRGTSNGVRLEVVGSDRIRELEPHVHGIAGLHIRDAGVVDFGTVARALADDLVDRGVELRLGCAVAALHETGREVRVCSQHDEIPATLAVNAAGLFADMLTPEGDHHRGDVRIIPFRGEYRELVASRAHLVQTLVYPVPDPDLPFLGVHLSRGVDDRVHAGPNALLATAREGYSWRDVDRREVMEMVRFPGFSKFVRRHWRSGLAELSRAFTADAVARSLRRMVPEIRAVDLGERSAGVRAQAVDVHGRVVDDFVFHDTARTISVLNAPSPGATASLAIGHEVAARALDRLGARP